MFLWTAVLIKSLSEDKWCHERGSQSAWLKYVQHYWEQSSRELMIVKWGQTAGTRAEGGRQREEGVKVITLSLVHCCLLSDLIWSRRHTWAEAHPSQVLQDPSITRSLLPSIHPSIPIFLRPSLSFPPFSSYKVLSLSPPIRSDLKYALFISLFRILYSHWPPIPLCCTTLVKRSLWGSSVRVVDMTVWKLMKLQEVMVMF